MRGAVFVEAHFARQRDGGIDARRSGLRHGNARALNLLRRHLDQAGRLVGMLFLASRLFGRFLCVFAFTLGRWRVPFPEKNGEREHETYADDDGDGK